MKSLGVSVLRYSFLVLLFVYSNSGLAYKILIDPGHGGIDTGAVNNQYVESNLALAISKKLKDRLEKNPIFKVQLTRSNDQKLTLENRVKVAEGLGADLLLSVHLNSAPEKTVKGTEIFFQNSLPASEESLLLAFNEENWQKKLNKPEIDLTAMPFRIGLEKATASTVRTVASLDGTNPDPAQTDFENADVASIVEDLKHQSKMRHSFEFSKALASQWPDRIRVQQAPFYVIARSTMPSVLIEVGYISNSKEAGKLSEDSYQNELTNRIYKALIKYKEKLDREPTLPLH